MAKQSYISKLINTAKNGHLISDNCNIKELLPKNNNNINIIVKSGFGFGDVNSVVVWKRFEE